MPYRPSDTLPPTAGAVPEPPECPTPTGAGPAGELRARLVPAVGAARAARELVTEACGRWDVPQAIGPACTVVTELVNNVVVHARTPMEVVLGLRDGVIRISVRDGSARPPDAHGPASPTSPGGRGLVMVRAVARDWGYAATDDGKVVWAELSTDEDPYR